MLDTTLIDFFMSYFQLVFAGGFDLFDAKSSRAHSPFF